MQVLKFMSHYSSEEYIRKHGVNSIKATEEEIVNSLNLSSSAVLKQVYKMRYLKVAYPKCINFSSGKWSIHTAMSYYRIGK